MNHAGKRIIFIGGSIVMRELPADIESILNTAMLEGGASFVVGDAPGVDTIVQGYLSKAGWSRVTVYCMNYARNNIGGWPMAKHKAPAGVTGRAWHAIKDRAMDAAATDGVMIWNGTSSGTRDNILALLGADKPCTVWTPVGTTTYKNLTEFTKHS